MSQSGTASEVPIAATAVIDSGNPKESLNVKNISGSTAGAGSGEFHTYRMARRREMFRLQQIEEMTAEQKAEFEFQQQKKKREEEFEAAHDANKQKRKKKKEREIEKRQREKANKKRKVGEGAEGAVSVPSSTEATAENGPGDGEKKGSE